MMVSPISSVRFGNTESNVQDILSRPGAFSRPAEEQQAPATQTQKKSGSFLKKVAGLVAAVAIIAGSLGALKHFNVVNKLSANELANAGFFKKIPHYLAVAGEQINKSGKAVIETVKGWIPKKSS